MKTIKRDYNLTDPDLVLKCEDVDDSIDRDIADFTARGYTPTKKTEFENAISSFDATPSDNYLLGQQELKTQAKNQVRQTCETKINVVLTGVKNVWGIESAQYHLFTENKPVSQLSDSDLLRFLEDFADSTDDHLGDLGGQGIDASTVTALRNLRSDFNEGLKKQRKAIKNRDIGNTNRIKKGNDLYKLLLIHTNTGKNIWLNIDEAKYNDYVIYDTPSGNPGHSVIRQSDIPSPGIETIDTQGVTITTATPCVLEATNTAIRYYFLSAPGGAPGAGDAFTDVQPGTTATVTAAQLGFSGTKIFLHAQNIGMVQGHFKITIG